MPKSTEAGSKTGLVIDRSSNTIRLVRELVASPEDVFDAWTQPDQVAVWWDPTGKPLAECTVDLRPGGSFRFVTADHPEMPFMGIYRLIERPYRLEFDAMQARGRVTLQPLGANARLTVEIQCGSAEHLEQFIKMGIDTGTGRTLDNLVDYAKRHF